MNVYGSQIWAINKTHLNKFYVAWRKAIRRIWKLPYRTHNKLLHLINPCLPIDVTLENRSIKYIWNLINGENKYMVALSNYHCIIIRQHLEKTSVILCINVRSTITNV